MAQSFPQTIPGKARSMLESLTLKQQVVLGLAVVSVILGTVLLVRWAFTPEMTPLYTGLTPEDAGAIKTQLDKKGEPYQIEDGGATIMVDRTRMNDLRVELSAEGLPRQDKGGYALLGQQGITTSSEIQNMNIKRAMEEEIAKTLEAFAQVHKAKILLAIPKQVVFATDKAKAGASVTLTLRRGGRLTDGQVESIVHLVASSIEGLSPESIAVSDTEGNLLHMPGESPGTGTVQQHSRVDQAGVFSDTLEKDITALLEKVVGPDNAKVTVASVLDFDKTNLTTESYETTGPATFNTVDAEGNQITGPAQRNPLAETSTRESFTGPGNQAGEVVNPGSPVTGMESEEESVYTHNKTEASYPYERIVEHKEKAPGSIQSLSIAALIDDKIVRTRAAKTAEKDIDDLSTQEVAAAETALREDLTQLIQAAVPFNAARGDLVNIALLPFDTTTDEKQASDAAATEAASARQALLETIRTAASILITILVLFSMWRGFRRQAKAWKAGRKPVTVNVDIAELEEAQQAAGELLAAEDKKEEKEEKEEETITPQETLKQLQKTRALEGQRLLVREEVSDFIDQRPDEVAQLLRRWLNEEE